MPGPPPPARRRRPTARPRIVAAAAAVLLVTGLVVVLAAGDDDPRTEVLSVAVPTSPDDPTPIELDAALHLPETTPAPAVLLAHGFGSDRLALADVAADLARDGYVVLTWSARGFGRSAGVIGLDDPDREVTDVTALVDLLAGRPEVAQRDGDPVVGIAGGSYGGGLALLAGSREPRLDAVVAAGAWRDLSRSLSPDAAGGPVGVLKEQWLAGLLASTAIGSLGQGGVDGQGGPDGQGSPDDLPFPTTGADGDTSGAPLVCGPLDPELCAAYVRTATAGALAPADARLLDRANPDPAAITAPTLLVAGLSDTLFPLTESLQIAREMTAGEDAPPSALRWVAGGHGEAARLDRPAVRAWLDLHLRGLGSAPPAFTWTDGTAGVDRESPRLPDDPAPDSTAPDGTAPDAPATDDASATTVLHADGDALVPDPPARPTAVAVAHPPGGLPAAVTTLPGLGGAGLGGGPGGALGALGVGPIDLPGQSTSLTTDALDADMTVLGTPVLRATLDALPDTAPGPALYVRLLDVAPGGRTTLIHDAVTPLRVPTGDGPREVEVPLIPLAHRVVAGHRLRLVVATTDLAHADGRDPAVVVATGIRLALPTTAVEDVAVTPVALRILAPVVLLALLALLAALATRRHEQRMAAEPDREGPAVEVRGLVKRYGDGHLAVDGLDLVVERGQVVGLLGPNGAGKTTTLRALLGLVAPTEGDVRILGHDVRPGHPVLARVGTIVEGPGFAPYLTGMQNLEQWWLAGGRPLAEADLDRALAVADLGAAIHRPVRAYSHGMRQRLAIAQALLGRPELLVLDEPTDGLDPEQIRGVRELVARLGEEGTTVLVSSHLLAEVEQMCTHVAVVDRGRLVAAGPVAELVGATRTVVLHVDDRAAARAALTDGEDPPLRPDQLGVEADGLVVELDGADVADLVAVLVGAGIRVRAVTPRGRLEDTFLALTGGGGR